MLTEREQMLQSHFRQSVLWSHLVWHKSWRLFPTQLSQCRTKAKAERDHLSRPLDKPGFLFIVSPTTPISARLLTSHLNNLKNDNTSQAQSYVEILFLLGMRGEDKDSSVRQTDFQHCTWSSSMVVMLCGDVKISGVQSTLYKQLPLNQMLQTIYQKLPHNSF